MERLDSALAGYSRELEFKVRRTGARNGSWIPPVRDALDDARAAQRDGRIEEAWASLKTAVRLDTFGAEMPEVLTRAEMLRREAATKLDTWRAQSVAALLDLSRPLDAPKTTERASSGSPPQRIDDDEIVWRVYQATLIRDQAGDNAYYKVALVREQRTLLLAFLAMAIVVLLGLAGTGWMRFDENPVSPSAGLLAGVALFGMLGACLSAISSMATVPSGRIPEHTMASKLTVARPFIGAAAALGVFAILQAGFLKMDTGEEAALAFAVAFAAGFSDRLVMGIIGSVRGP